MASVARWEDAHLLQTKKAVSQADDASTDVVAENQCILIRVRQIGVDSPADEVDEAVAGLLILFDDVAVAR